MLVAIYTDARRVLFTKTTGELRMLRRAVCKSERFRLLFHFATRAVHLLTEVAVTFLSSSCLYRILLFVMSAYWRSLPEHEQQRETER